MSTSRTELLVAAGGRLVALASLAAIAVACATQHIARAPAHSGVRGGSIPRQSPDPGGLSLAQAAHVGHSRWTLPLPIPFSAEFVRISGLHVVTAGSDGIVAGDATTGKRLWHTAAPASALAIEGNDVLAGTSSGGLARMRANDGKVVWRHTICASSKRARHAPAAPGAIDAILIRHSSIVVGCEGGDLAIVDRATGAVGARAHPFDVDTFLDVRPLGDCAYGATAVSSGASLVRHIALLECQQLRTIFVRDHDAALIGAVGDVAIIGICCDPMRDWDRPAKIVRIDLATRNALPEAVLWPEPGRHPLKDLPPGEGATFFLAGRRLFLGVQRSLYEYPDVLRLSAPSIVSESLDDGPHPVGNGYAVLQENTGHGFFARLLDLRSEPSRVVWMQRNDRALMISYDPDEAPGIVRLWNAADSFTRYVRIDDGAVLRLRAAGDRTASDGKLIVLAGYTHRLVGDRYTEYLEAFAFSQTAH